jgi:hypothetical protein
MAFEVELAQHALVAERAEHDSLRARHVERLEPRIADAREDVLGDGGVGFGS